MVNALIQTIFCGILFVGLLLIKDEKLRWISMMAICSSGVVISAVLSFLSK